jgi:hypothetical protein
MKKRPMNYQRYRINFVLFALLPELILRGQLGTSVMRISIPLDLSSRSFIPLPRFIRSRCPIPLLDPSLVLFHPCSAFKWKRHMLGVYFRALSSFILLIVLWWSRGGGKHTLKTPFVIKSRKGKYDGRVSEIEVVSKNGGVQCERGGTDRGRLFEWRRTATEESRMTRSWR